MAQDLTQIVGIDVSEGVRAAAAMEKSLGSLGKKWTDVMSVVGKTTTDAGDATTLVFKVMLDQFRTQEVTLQKSGKGWFEAARGVIEYTDAMNKNVQATLKNNATEKEADRIRQSHIRVIKELTESMGGLLPKFQQMSDEQVALARKELIAIKQLGDGAEKISHDRLLQETEDQKKLTELLDSEAGKRRAAARQMNADLIALEKAETDAFELERLKRMYADQQFYSDSDARQKAYLEKKQKTEDEADAEYLSRKYKRNAADIEAAEKNAEDAVKAASRRAYLIKQNALMTARVSGTPFKSTLMSVLTDEQLEAQFKGLSAQSKVEAQTVANARKTANELNAISNQRKNLEISNIYKVRDASILALEKSTASLVRFRTEGQKSSDHVALTLQEIGRIAQFAIFYRGLYALSTAIQQSIGDARRLQVAIGEIQTISQAANVTVGEWTEGIRRLSDEFGNPILDVAAATYETLSNQIAEGKDALVFMREEAKLSILTQASLKESVDATSSVLNAFNLATTDAGQVNQILFGLVDRGRVKLDELSNSMGRTNELSHELGVSFEEQASAIAILTRAGLKNNVAQTLLTNLYQKMIRPSKEMTEIFERWGVTSGQAAIAAFGFGGVLEKLQVEAAKGGDELAEFGKQMINIRALQAKVILTSQGMAQELIEIKKSAEQANSGMDLIANNGGKKLQVEMNKIKNFFTVDMGNWILSFFSAFNEGSGVAGNAMQLLTLGTTGLKNQVVALYTAVKTGLAMWLGYRGALLLVNGAGLISKAVFAQMKVEALLLDQSINRSNINMLRWKATMTLLSGAMQALPMAALTVGIGVAAYAFDRYINRFSEMKQAGDEAKQAMTELNEKLFADQIKLNQKDYETWSENLKAKFQAFLQFTANIRAANSAMAVNVKDALKAVSIESDDAFKRTLDTIDDKIKEVTKGAEKALALSEKMAEKAKDRRGRIEDSEFTEKMSKLDPLKSGAEVMKRIAELKELGKAAFLVGNEKDGEDYYKRAEELFKAHQDRLLDIKREADRVKTEEAEKAKARELRAEERVEDATLRASESVMGTGRGRSMRTARASTFRTVTRATEAESRLEEDRIKTEKEVAAAKAKSLDIDKAIAKNLEDMRAFQKEMVETELELSEIKKKEAAVAKKSAADDALRLGALKLALKMLESFDPTKQTKEDFDALLGHAEDAATLAGVDDAKELELFKASRKMREILAHDSEVKISEQKLDEIAKRIRAEEEMQEKARKAKLDADSKLIESTKKSTDDVAGIVRTLGTGLRPLRQASDKGDPLRWDFGLQNIKLQMGAKPSQYIAIQKNLDAIAAKTKKVEDANKNVNTAEGFEIWKDELGELINLLEDFDKISKGAVTQGKNKSFLISPDVGGGERTLKDVISDLYKSRMEVKNGFDATEEANKAIDHQGKLLKSLREDYHDLIDQYPEYREGMKLNGEATGDLSTRLKEIKTDLENAAKGFEKVRDNAKRLGIDKPVPKVEDSGRMMPKRISIPEAFMDAPVLGAGAVDEAVKENLTFQEKRQKMIEERLKKKAEDQEKRFAARSLEARLEARKKAKEFAVKMRIQKDMDAFGGEIKKGELGIEPAGPDIIRKIKDKDEIDEIFDAVKKPKIDDKEDPFLEAKRAEEALERAKKMVELSKEMAKSKEEHRLADKALEERLRIEKELDEQRAKAQKEANESIEQLHRALLRPKSDYDELLEVSIDANSSMINGANNVAAAMQNVINQQNAMIYNQNLLASSGTSTTPGYFNSGGLVYRNQGGIGKDQSLVAMSGTEFIMNESATKSYLPLLRMMNLSQGNVNNSNQMGDVTINVHGSSSPEAVGNNVMHQIRRAQRMGNYRL